MIQFVSGNIEQATKLMLFNSGEILLKLELYLKNIFKYVQIHRSNTNTNTPIWYFSNTNTNTNICVFEYKYKYEYVFGPSPACGKRISTSYYNAWYHWKKLIRINTHATLHTPGAPITARILSSKAGEPGPHANAKCGN